MPKTIASLSLDLDNKWAYLRTHGDTAWRGFPCFLETATPRAVEMVAAHGAAATVFVVGRDLAHRSGRDAVRQFADAGWEIGNHTQNHYPWLAALPAAEIEREVVEAEEAIGDLVGAAPVGFRAPGFSWSDGMLSLLVRRDYRYDASAFPTSIGPLASAYSRFRLPQPGEADEPAPLQTFATLADALRSLHPHQAPTAAGPLAELPVTTMPLTRLPIHVTYLTFLAQTSLAAARAYARLALGLCRLRGVAPSMLLHPLDFLGAEEEPGLAFFPGMRLSREPKLELVSWLLSQLTRSWGVATVAEHIGAALPQQTPTQPIATPVREAVSL